MSNVVVFNNMTAEMTRMTVPEAARYTGKNAETIRRWIRAGKLRSEKIGTQYLVYKDDLDYYLMPIPPMGLPPGWRPEDTLDIDWAKVIRDQRDSH